MQGPKGRLSALVMDAQGPVVPQGRLSTLVAQKKATICMWMYGEGP